MIPKRKSLLIYYLLEFGIDTMSLNGSKIFVKHNTFKKNDATLKTYEKQHSCDIQSIYGTKYWSIAHNKWENQMLMHYFINKELLSAEIKNTLIEYDVFLKWLINTLIHHWIYIYMTYKYHQLCLFILKLLKNSCCSNMLEQLTLIELASILESTLIELEPTLAIKD